MSSIVRPETQEQLRETVQWAVSEEKPLEVVGTGSKQALGRPAQQELTLDMSAFKGVTLYEPEELVLSARVATPRAAVEKKLKAKGQEFAFDPPDLSKLLGAKNSGTLGGMIATNFAGPRRIKAGAVRDHFLGFTAVSGRGEIFKSGGRVVKNVTGYDLSKVMAGSWGTLAVMSDVTLKVLPAAETEATFTLEDLSDENASKAMSAALQSSCEVSSAAHLPENIKGAATTALRLEGIDASVEYRFGKLAELLAPFGKAGLLKEKASRKFWAEVRDVASFAGKSERPVWRISVPPMDGHKVIKSISAVCEARYYFDWGGGLIWCEVPEDNNASVHYMRGALVDTTGHATLIRAPQQTRAAVDVFQRPSPGLAILSTRMKEAFDPQRILNPGRLYPEA